MDAPSVDFTASPTHPNYVDPCPEGVLDVDNDGVCDDSDLCTDITACNYNGSLTANAFCNYESCAGCMSPLACNFDSAATLDDSAVASPTADLTMAAMAASCSWLNVDEVVIPAPPARDSACARARSTSREAEAGVRARRPGVVRASSGAAAGACPPPAASAGVATASPVPACSVESLSRARADRVAVGIECAET